MKIKAEQDAGCVQFQQEIEHVVDDLQKFMDEVEYDIAVAESLDPAQELLFF